LLLQCELSPQSDPEVLLPVVEDSNEVRRQRPVKKIRLVLNSMTSAMAAVTSAQALQESMATGYVPVLGGSDNRCPASVLLSSAFTLVS
jgi:hypothetical protein